MSNEVRSTFGGKNQNLLVTLIAILLFTGAGFFGGMKFQQSKSVAGFRGRMGGGNGPFVMQFDGNGKNVAIGNGQQMMKGRIGGGQVAGEIISVDGQSITVKMEDGSSKIVLITGSTGINKASEGSASDLKVGEKVAVFGAANNDGTVTATNIHLNPVMRRLEQTPTSSQ